MSAHQHSSRTATGKLAIIGGLAASSLALVVVGLVWLPDAGNDVQFSRLDGVQVLTDSEMKQIKAGWGIKARRL